MNSEPIEPRCRFHFYLAKFADAVYVLHAFSKKTRTTSKQDIDLASDRFRAVIEERKRQKR